MRTLELIHSLKKYTLLAVVLSCVPPAAARRNVANAIFND